MQTRAPSLKKLLMPAAFALVCAALTVLIFRSFGGSLPLEPKGYRISVPMPQASNLVPGSGVQMAGVRVGRVAGVERDGNAARVRIEIDAEHAPVGSRASAIVRTKTLLGEGYLELAPGPRDAEPVPEGGELPASQVSPSVQLDEFLETFEPATRRRFQELFAGLAGATKGRERELSNSLARSEGFSANFRRVLESLDSDREALGRVVSGSADVLEAMAEREGALAAAVSAGERVMDATAERDRGLAATVRALPAFLGRLESTSRRLTEAAPDLEAASRSLLGAAPLLEPTLERIQSAAPDFRGLFEDLPQTIRAGERGLPAVAPLSRAARVGFREFYPTSRELIPFMQLFAVNRDAVRYTFANTANVNAGVYVGPQGIVHNYGTGFVTVWNETISGWKHKLPTNRQNPYPRPPDSLLDIGRQGFLNSYDCRHVNNPLILPATGLGAPPCVEEGAWEFNGVEAYYPRLKLAPP